jgi:hypothetical protein
VGRVHPSGSPWRRSHSVGVRRRTEDGEIDIVLPPSAGRIDAIADGAASGEWRGDDERDPAPGAVLGGVEAFGSKSVRDEGDVPVKPGAGRTDAEGSDETGVVEVIATRASAVANGLGNVFPRRVARRKIPAAALGLKQYLGGTLASSTSAKEVDAPPPLGHAEVSAVQHSPGEIVNPEVGQRRENEGEIAAAVRGKQSGYVLKEHPAPSGEKSGSDAGELEEEPAPLARQPGAPAGDGDVLAGEAADEQITCGMAWMTRPRAVPCPPACKAIVS